MFLSTNDLEYLFKKAEYFSTSKLHALDAYWNKNSSHPTHQRIHELIELILIKRGEKTLKQERINHIKSLEKSLKISNSLGRLSANILGFANKILLSKFNQI